MWQPVAASGKGKIVWVEGRIDSTKYHEILGANVAEYVKKLKLSEFGY